MKAMNPTRTKLRVRKKTVIAIKTRTTDQVFKSSSTVGMLVRQFCWPVEIDNGLNQWNVFRCIQQCAEVGKQKEKRGVLKDP